MDEIVKFYSKSSTAKILSNFYEKEFIMGTNKFISGEHAFHFHKYNTAAICAIITNNDLVRGFELIEHSKKFIGDKLKTALDAKRAGGKSKKGLELFESEIIAWNSVSMDIQKKICYARLNADKELLEILLSTDDSYLLHQDNRAKDNTIWGGKIDKDDPTKLIGKNLLGKIWMIVRSEINK